MNLDAIGRHFDTDEKARAYLEAVRWPDGPVCPHCGQKGEGVYRIAANPGKKVRAGLLECRPCGKQFTVTVGTIFEDSKIPLRKWLVAWYLLCSSKKGISALQIQRNLALGSYRTAWFMMHRIRYALRDPVFADKLDGIVEADETYVGGKPRYKGLSKPGRGTRKVPVVALVERDGRARARVVKKVTAKNLKAILRENVSTDARLMTDEFQAYVTPGRPFASHETVNHGAKEYARGDVSTNSVEGYFSLLKRGLVGTFHHVDRRYLDNYLAEFSHRWSERKVTDGERTVAGLRKVEGKRLTFQAPKV